MDVDNHYFWSKNQRPSPEKDHIRNEIASICMAHLKTQATIMKTVHVDPNKPSSFLAPSDSDLTPNIVYSLNKKRRWEAYEDIGLEVLNQARKLNIGWETILLERVNLRSWIGTLYNYGSSLERYTDWFMVKSVRRFDEQEGYKESKLDSIYGQRYSHFVKENRLPSKKGVEIKEDGPTVAYNFLRAPDNYLELLEKGYRSSNYGWEWPHHKYWRRLDLLKDHLLWLRYGEFEEFDEELDNDEDDDNANNDTDNRPARYYNLEEHLVEKEDTDGFVMVKRRKCRK